MDKLKILVVDDESRMRKLVSDFLTRSNYDVLEAENGEQALDIFYKEPKCKRQFLHQHSNGYRLPKHLPPETLGVYLVRFQVVVFPLGKLV